MEFNENGFYKHNGNFIEGFIGDDKKSLDEVRLVFILKEPNSGNNEADTFWFKNTVEGAENGDKLDRYQNVYYNKLGKIACLLLGYGDKQKASALKQCAYINLYPVKGGKEASEQYKKVIEAFKNKDVSNDFANSRWDIINNLPNDCKIITVEKIFNAIKINKTPNNEIIQKLTIKNNRVDKKFKAFSFNNGKGKIEVYSIYHPQARGRNSFTAEDIFFNK